MNNVIQTRSDEEFVEAIQAETNRVCEQPVKLGVEEVNGEFVLRFKNNFGEVCVQRFAHKATADYWWSLMNQSSPNKTN